MHIYSMVQGCVRRLLYFHCPICFLEVVYCIVLYCIVLYCIVLYCIVLYCIVLYCIVLYCIVLYRQLPSRSNGCCAQRHGQCVCVCHVCNGWSGEARGGLELRATILQLFSTNTVVYFTCRQGYGTEGLISPPKDYWWFILLTEATQMIVIQPLFRNRRCHFD